MILVDEDATTTLAAALDIIRLDPAPGLRAVYMHHSQQTEVPDLRAKVIAAAQTRFESPHTQLYFLEDGDICLITPLMRLKDANLFVVDMAELLKCPAEDSWINIYDVAHQWGKLHLIIEAKKNSRARGEQEKQKLQEQREQERKRQAILTGGMQNKFADIEKRRTARPTVELMMIEDDAFSRRLVENVLHNKYPLTGLGEATRAIDTYALLAPDLLFLDINLPDVTGHELLERLLAIDPGAYIVMLSGNADQSNIVQAMSKGAKGFIAKPFTKEKLFQYIDRCPGIASKQQKLENS